MKGFTSVSISFIDRFFLFARQQMYTHTVDCTKHIKLMHIPYSQCNSINALDTTRSSRHAGKPINSMCVCDARRKSSSIHRNRNPLEGIATFHQASLPQPGLCHTAQQAQTSHGGKDDGLSLSVGAESSPNEYRGLCNQTLTLRVRARVLSISENTTHTHTRATAVMRDAIATRAQTSQPLFISVGAQEM